MSEEACNTLEAFCMIDEEIQKIVDGVIADILSGHLDNQQSAQTQMLDACEESTHVNHPRLALRVLEYGIAGREEDIKDLAYKILSDKLKSELGRRDEFKKLPAKKCSG